MNDKRIPNEDECLDIMKKCDMMSHIIDHSIQVKNVSMAIFDNLIDKKIISREKIIAGALLHDIAKSKCIREKTRGHDKLGGDMLREKGLDIIAPIVESHIFFDDFDFDGSLQEREIIFYADKRVMHDQIVTIEARVKDLVDRYGTNNEIISMIIENKKFVYTIEKKIQRFLNDKIEKIISKLEGYHPGEE